MLFRGGAGDGFPLAFAGTQRRLRRHGVEFAVVERPLAVTFVGA